MKKVKKFLSAVLIATGIATAFTGCGKTSGADGGRSKGKDMSGQCGDNLTYEYLAKGGKLIIRGTGEMTSCPWSGYGGVVVKSVEFEEGITNIYHGAFYGQNELAGDIVLPSTVTYIDDLAFYGTSKLGSVKLPEGVTYLGDYAFRQSGIKGELFLPDSITYIGEECFDDCTNLTGTLKLPASLQKIGRVAFNGCKGFTGDLIIPDSVTEIGDYAFASCPGFDGKLVISQNLTEIEANCFNYDTGFRGDLIIPDGVKRIGEGAFRGCTFDGMLKLPGDVLVIDESAFSYCENLKGEVIIPDGIDRINCSVFEKCKGISSVVFPSGLKYICRNAFYGCEGLSGEIAFPEGLVGIGSYSFSGCKNISGALNMPETVEIIEAGAFEDCEGFTGELIIPSKVVNIGKRAFDNCVGLTGNLVIHDNVVVIGAEAFRDCKGIDNVIIGTAVRSIGERAFANCLAVSKVTFKNGDVLPDYYVNTENNSEDSFPQQCELVVNKAARLVRDVWGSEHKALETKPAGEFPGVEAMGEVPYYWTDSLRQYDFVGVGEFADTTMKFDAYKLSISINGREAESYSFYADANGNDNSVITDQLWYKDGYIEKLEYLIGYKIVVVRGTYIRNNGEKQDIYFVSDNSYSDTGINLKISIEENVLESPF